MDVGDKVKLEPCPFCGSTDIGHQTFDEDDSRDFVMCNGCGVFAQRNDCEAEPVEVWNRRTPSASIGEDGLPELPAPKWKVWNGREWTQAWSDNEVRACMREAVAADRQSNNRQMIVKQQARAGAGSSTKNAESRMDTGFDAGAGLGVKTWQERVTDNTPAHEYPDAMRAEINDLRAQLARQSQSKPVAEWVNWEQGFQYLVEPPLPEGTKLYAAPPLSSEPQKGN